MKKIMILAVILAALLQISGCSGKMSANTVYSADDLKGKNIGVVTGSAATVYADGYGTLHPYQSAETSLVDLRNGVIDCCVMDEALAKSLIKKIPGLKILSHPLVQSDFCFAIAKENPDLLEAVNSALKDLKESGVLDKIIQGYIPGDGYRYKSPDNLDTSRGTLTLAVDAALPPYTYKDDSGQPVGLDIDLARAVCDSLHVKMTVAVMDESELIQTVQYGKAEFSLGGVVSNDQDAKLVDFSKPYIRCTQVIVVRQ
jgi:ABC-type amino acid transport substrate-binding protein